MKVLKVKLPDVPKGKLPDMPRVDMPKPSAPIEPFVFKPIIRR